MSALQHVYETYIRTTPESLWDALVSAEITRRYFFGTAVETDWLPGSRFTYVRENGSVVIDGEVLEHQPPRRLAMTFRLVEGEATRDDPPSRVTWTIEPMGEVCKLTLVHDQFDHETTTYQSVNDGWFVILSGLKTLLETGQPLEIGQPG